MKSIAIFAGIFLASTACAQMRTYRTDSVIVTSTRAGETTPMPHTELRHEELQSYARDMPFMLQMTPSVVATSDAGAGVGYTGLRIRGTDATRINVTLNGVPMNDAESQGMFWVNTPDVAASVGSVQVQRGVGTSTNGAGAFGGSVNMLLQRPSRESYGTISASYGSFGTHKESLAMGSGLLKEHWTLDLRLSNIGSEGFIKRGTVRNRSYLARAGWQDANTLITLLVMDGKERTGLAWEGVTAAQMEEHGRRWNPLGLMADGVTIYPDQTDNYRLTNLQAHLLQDLGGGFTLTGALHYYKGDGYYEEYKAGVDLAEYALQGTRGDVVRRKMMDNWFGGGVFSVDYRGRGIEASVGGAANRYDGQSFGRVIWPTRTKYYSGTGVKDDGNVYAKASWEVLRGLFLYGDLQYRLIKYRVDGTTDSWINGTRFAPDVDEMFNFFNPKAGVFYRAGKVNIYGSVAVAHREPPRNNYTEAPRFVDGKPIMPRPERLTDFELGFSRNGERLNVGANLYYMRYKDQLVLNGETNEIGEALSENVPESYRLGVELMAGYQFTGWLRWDVNATLSRNRILDYYDPVGDRTLAETHIAYSPSLLVGSLLSARHNNFGAALQTNHVGSQYVTNFEQKALSLDAYWVTNLLLDYTVGRTTFGLHVNNLFDARYESNGWGYDWMEGTQRVAEMYYFPQAGINFMANVTCRFGK